MTTPMVASLVVIAGSILFLIAAFSPISRVFGMTSAEEKWQLISASRSAWVIAQAMFALGAIVTAVGVLLAAGPLQGKPTSSAFYVAGGLLLIGALAWSWHAYLRGQDPRAFVDGALPGWHFILYSIFTLAGFGLLGYSLLKMGFPSWSAWVLMGGSFVLLVLYVVFRDMPPFVYYLMGLVLGIVLYRGS